MIILNHFYSKRILKVMFTKAPWLLYDWLTRRNGTNTLVWWSLNRNIWQNKAIDPLESSIPKSWVNMTVSLAEKHTRWSMTGWQTPSCRVVSEHRHLDWLYFWRLCHGPWHSVPGRVFRPLRVYGNQNKHLKEACLEMDKINTHHFTSIAGLPEAKTR